MDRKCVRCGKEFELETKYGVTNVCGNCADDLRAEEDAMEAQAMAEAEAEERAKWEAEDAERIARDKY